MSLRKIEKDVKKRLPKAKEFKEFAESASKIGGVIPPAVTWIAGEGILQYLQTREYLVVDPKIKKGQPETYKALQEQFGSDANICKQRPVFCVEGNILKKKIDVLDPIPIPWDNFNRTFKFGQGIEYGQLLRTIWFIMNALTAFRR